MLNLVTLMPPGSACKRGVGPAQIMLWSMGSGQVCLQNLLLLGFQEA